MPIFILGTFAIYLFSFNLFRVSSGLLYFPSFGAHSWDAKYGGPLHYFVDEVWHLVLPMLVLGYTMMALYVRLVRSRMRETLEQDYILAARASGLSERNVVYKHGLRNAIIPLITFLGISIAASLGGAPITETVFTWPGLGYFYVVSVSRLDFPVIMGINAILTLMILAGNIVVDILYGVIDPRITLE
jgi:peptide/nickel transport system permease protein